MGCCDYHEMNLDWVIKKILELETDWESDLNALEKALKEYIDTQDNLLENKITSVQSQFQDYIIIFKNELNNRIDFEVVNLMNYINANISNLETQIKNLRFNPIVINPSTGHTDTLQNVLNMLYRSIYIWCLTCGEYASIGLTCQEYADLELTCEEYAYMSKLLMGWKQKIWYLTHMVSPESGLWISIKDAINWLASLHQVDCLTCGEYELVDLTCEEYGALDITCHDYAWNSVNLVKKG